MGFHEDDDGFVTAEQLERSQQELDAAVTAKVSAVGENQPTGHILETGDVSEKKGSHEEEVPEQQGPDDVDAAAVAMCCQDEQYEEPMFVICQICMDVMLVDETVTQLCGKACLAEICSLCLVQHLIATVYSFYPGALPKVRCPICLSLMNKNQWVKFVTPDQETATAPAETAPAENQEGGEQSAAAEAAPAATTTDDDTWRLDNSHVLEKYETLCRQSCEFQSPCCHNPAYTMLPTYKARSSAEEGNEHLRVTLPRSQAAQIPTLRKRCRAFCYHREDTKQFYALIFDTFQENAETVFWKVLGMISDEERRATLLLHHLFLHPDTRTHCCNGIVCFKCKTSVHHNGQCSDFVEADCVLQCRGCHVTLVKVDGCDSVTCICGHSISWQTEIEKQRLQRKQLAPENETQYEQWEQWTSKLGRSLPKISALDTTMREMRLHRMIRAHKPLFRKMVVRYKSARAGKRNRADEVDGDIADED